MVRETANDGDQLRTKTNLAFPLHHIFWAKTCFSAILPMTHLENFSNLEGRLHFVTLGRKAKNSGKVPGFAAKFSSSFSPKICIPTRAEFLSTMRQIFSKKKLLISRFRIFPN